jgi:hypothetical protein
MRNNEGQIDRKYSHALTIGGCGVVYWYWSDINHRLYSWIGSEILNVPTLADCLAAMSLRIGQAVRAEQLP